MSNPRDILKALFQSALDAASPKVTLKQWLPEPPVGGQTIVIGAGKAAGSMAEAVEAAWSGPLSGIVVTRYDHGAPCHRIKVIEAAHPVPDAAGLGAAKEILERVQGLSGDDLVLCLISGGGSALLTMPGEGISLEEKQAVNKALLKCGAPIDEMNTVRKHLSAIKGGRLAAAAYPARVVTLAISDVPGDDPAVIASGPTVPDPTTGSDALALIDKHEIELPDHVRTFLTSRKGETPKPGDEVFANSEFRMISTPQMALDAAAGRARELGLDPVVLGDALEGEARELAKQMADDVLQRKRTGNLTRPTVFLSGGETTVTIRGKGRGGRNAEFLLGLTIALDGAAGVHAIACDTDGIDGSEDNAGAICGPDSLARARSAGLDAPAMLDNNDGYGFFDALDDLIVTGPTLTNVNDFRAILVMPEN